MNSTKALLRLGLLLAMFSVLLSDVSAQTGYPPFSAVQSDSFDQIDLANLNVHLAIPLYSKRGRGIDVKVALNFDNGSWTKSGGKWNWSSTGFWHPVGQTLTGTVGHLSSSATCPNGSGTTIVYGWTYTDPTGAIHPFPNIQYDTAFCLPNPVYQQTTTDGSGYNMNNGYNGFYLTSSITAPNGTHFDWTSNTGTGVVNYITDANRNAIAVGAANGLPITDTQGTTVLSSSTVSCGSFCVATNFSYLNPQGTNSVIQETYLNTNPFAPGHVLIGTNFGCSGVLEGTTNQLNVATNKVTLPDGSSYSITYEATPGKTGYTTGRIASITLPTGGVISYTYPGPNDGINCADGSVLQLTRQTPDGTWNYVRTPSGSNWITTVTDPAGNQTLYTFSGTVVTQVQTYQGTSSAGTLLQTTTLCYNGNTTNCASAATNGPIAEKAVIIKWPNGITAEGDTFYNSAGLVTEVDTYDYGVNSHGPLLQKAVESYAVLGNNIVDRPASIVIQDAASNIVKKTVYGYDETAVIPTSNTPMHNPASGSRGNLTSIREYTDATHYLSRTFTYNDTGTVASGSDINSQITNFQYTVCGNSYMNGMTLPLNLAESFSWNCSGGKVIGATTPNGGNGSIGYGDPNFWRATSITDVESNVTNILFPSSTQTEASLTFNGGASTLDVVGTRDSLGRASVSQRRQSPSSTTFDSDETDYDSFGRISRFTLPYSATIGQKNAAAAGATITYDALNRMTQVLKSGGATVTYTYVGNDETTALTPTPPGETQKSTQFEIDGKGRLSSICEINNINGSGTCGQTNAVNGFWTKYTYDAADRVISIVQNAQSTPQQTRSFQYDWAGRLLSETLPETGTTQFTYDSDPVCGNYPGDLVKKVDAAGNVACYAYDALHRLTVITFPNSTTASKHYVYDSASLNGTTMANTSGRLAEAYTGSPSSKLTDVYFSYSQLGRIVDLYQSTPHSGGYYHLTTGYWPNGEVRSVSGLSGLPTLTSTLDGEGRVTSISSSSGQNPVTNVGYTTFQKVSTITYGSGDSDSFSFDSNTDLMTQYRHNVGSANETGVLTWNPNETLSSLAITDGFVPANNQSCSFSYDALLRLGAVNCGAAWSQTFSYDSFGNISKSGTSAFQPTYDETTNRIQSIPGVPAVSYDGAGDLKNDGTYTYSWNAEPRVIGVTSPGASVGLTYDALGRIAEISNGGGYVEVLYGASGAKFALMNGQTLQKAFVAVPGGGTTVFTPTNSYYRHADWLGSARVTSSNGATLLGDIEYAPFGETYDQYLSPDLVFTGINQDSISGLYDFAYREYSPGQGRWVSADPLHALAFDGEDPQSLNLYSYLRNRPCGSIDGGGLDVKCTIYVKIGSLQYGKPGDPFAQTPQMQAIEGEIQSIFGEASVGVEFNNDSAPTDDFLSIMQANNGRQGETDYGYSVVDFALVANGIPANNSNVLTSVGQVAVHEITHAIIQGAFSFLGAGNIPLNQAARDNANHSGIFAVGANPDNPRHSSVFADYGDIANGYDYFGESYSANCHGCHLTDDQKKAILAACFKLRESHPGPPGRAVLPPVDVMGWWSSLWFDLVGQQLMNTDVTHTITFDASLTESVTHTISY